MIIITLLVCSTKKKLNSKDIINEDVQTKSEMSAIMMPFDTFLTIIL